MIGKIIAVLMLMNLSLYADEQVALSVKVEKHFQQGDQVAMEEVCVRDVAIDFIDLRGRHPQNAQPMKMFLDCRYNLGQIEEQLVIFAGGGIYETYERNQTFTNYGYMIHIDTALTKKTLRSHSYKPFSKAVILEHKTEPVKSESGEQLEWLVYRFEFNRI